MIVWNYRVFREPDGDYVIREVFYAEDGAILGCTENAVEPFGRTLEELAESIRDFQAALTLPVLTLDDIPRPMTPPLKRQRSRTISHEQLRTQLGLSDNSGSSE